MASLPTRTTASFDAIKPVSSLVLLDDELNDIKGATGFLNGGTTGKKLLVKSSDGADPPLEIDQIGAGPLAEWKQNGTLKVSINNSGQIVSDVATGTAPFDVDSTTEVANLNASRVGGIVGANVAIIGTSKIPFTLSFKIDDPTTPSLNDQSTVNLVRVPAVQSGFITKVTIIYASGSHTAGGSCTFRVFINGSGVGSGVSFTDANATAFTFYTEDFADQAITDGTSVTVVISARSGTVSERNVTINVEGYQTIKA